ncbi:GGDEF domain-containing protein [Azonexus hydrophilus]|uniref:GGDEF domain-containing protein n=1 Tax=Azonexus hydrophilus TaxID=418702 RepID=UPI0003F6642A|nr:GGDEF domain-containing protein [Azonexus hydrophilus]
MSNPATPFEIARDTLKQLAQRRIAPTPDNYQTLYHEIAGTKPVSKDFPEKHLRTLSGALPKSSPDQMRLARQLDEAVKAEDWDAYQKHLTTFINGLIESQKLAWGELIGDLLRQWETKHAGVTSARKRESLEHVLNGSANNPDNLFSRLQSLMRSWGQGREGERPTENTSEEEIAAPATAAVTGSNDPALLAELRELFAFTLETAIATQLIESPQLAQDAKQLASHIRRARKSDELKEFLSHLKRFAFKLELLAEDQQELRKSLLGLLRLLVENMTELVIDDRWLHGQIEVVRDIIEKPLSQRAIDDAERRLKEVLFKQSQLKAGLFETREAIKQMLTGFVDHLADFADATSDYHDKIERYADKISAADNITELENVIDEVMRETRSIQTNAQRSRDELRLTQEKVKASEARIRELEMELEKTSDLVRHDQLTGVLNRHGLEEMFDKEVARALRHDTVLCVALLDIDNFKKLNDSLGHDAGDQALIHLASVCRETLRPQDTIARFGGEEFVILLPETQIADATHVLVRLQRELTKRFFLHDNEKVLITFSAGVTQMTERDNQASVIKRADEAMYKAKQTGKNRVETVMENA